MLLLGDFSAKPASQKPPLAQRQCHRVDFDTVDEVLSRLSPELALAAGVVSFDKLDAFHPEQLYARVPLFDELRQARSKPLGSASLLDELLGKTPAASSSNHPATETATAKTGLDSLLRQLVTPHIVPDQATSLQAQQAAVDAVITEHMPRLLHEPAFQQLESAWRGAKNSRAKALAISTPLPFAT